MEKRWRKLGMEELNRPSPEVYSRMARLPVTVVLDNVRSCHNTGSVFRTSDALLVEKIVLCGITATPPDREIHKTALDAEKSVPWVYFSDTPEAVRELKDQGVRVYAVEQTENSTLLPDFYPDRGVPCAFVFGNEVRGVSQEVIDICDGVVEIPQYGTKHSFNLAVSAGILLWEVTRRLMVVSPPPVPGKP